MGHAGEVSSRDWGSEMRVCVSLAGRLPHPCSRISMSPGKKACEDGAGFIGGNDSVGAGTGVGGGELQRPREGWGTAGELGPWGIFLKCEEEEGTSQGTFPCPQEIQSSILGSRIYGHCPILNLHLLTTYYVLGTVGSPSLILATSLQRGLISSHSVDEEMEAQGDEMICPGSGLHAGKWSELGLEARSRWWQRRCLLAA